jgi:hypothetical protein
MEEEDDSNAITRFFRNLFTREVPPEHWDEQFMGEFNAETARMFGFEVETETRWGMVALTAGIAIALVAVPVIIIIIRKKKHRFDFDEE